MFHAKSFFVEVIYQQDNSDSKAERLNIFNSLKGLNSYLENEFRTAF
jgi:hypothetical protein